MSGQVSQERARRVVGIDLGTTNCAVAWAPGQEPGETLRDFAVPQLVGPGLVAELPLLPSCLYLASPYEFGPSQLRLPWTRGVEAEAEEGSGARGPVLGGAFARQLGGRNASRLVSSAKSWLCHPRVDRRAPILPWGAPTGSHKLSPVEASAAYLRHLAAAWDQAHSAYPLAEQDLVLTVPASFDDAARALTVEAARAAGLTRLRLVEEPQAAFHELAWTRHKELDTLLDGVERVLVVDVGGGTSDFSLIRVSRDAAGAPVFERAAVGEHLMLGGDNMDVALAHEAEPKLAGEGRRLSPAQWGELVQAARTAKEGLLAREAPEQHRVSVAGEGSRLLGRTLSHSFQREELRRLLLDGFFPFCAPDEAPRRQARSGLQELGLPYAQDAAITRHLAAFLRQQAVMAEGATSTGVKSNPAESGELREAASSGASLVSDGLLRPDAVLLNGGVFKGEALVERLLAVLASWWPGQPPPRLLPHASLDVAVARGAVAHGLSRRGLGPRIGGGSSHAYYVGVGSAGAKAGASTTATAQVLCLVPQGAEEGVVTEVRELPMELTLGTPVRFPLYAASSRTLDRAGVVLPVTEALVPIAPMQTVLRSASGRQGREPVFLRVSLTELGLVELACVSLRDGQSWLLELDVRGAEETEPAGHAAPAPQQEACEALLRSAFEGKGAGADPKELRLLFKKLETELGPREQWTLAQLRSLWTWVQPFATQRRRSPDLEKLFYQVSGYTLRPGFGDSLDAWRCEQMLALLPDLVRHVGDQSVWSEFWILWRRLACGLDETAQLRLWGQLKPHLARRVPPKPPKHLARPKGIPFEGLEEMVRLAASLELLPVEEKREYGAWLLERVREPGQVTGVWAWSLGRLGARVPVGEGVHRVLPAAEAEAWIQVLLKRGLTKIDGGVFALAQLARCSGDRGRDISDTLRAEVLGALAAAKAPERLLRQVSELVELEAAEQAKALGDSLPVGLVLRGA